MGRIPFIYIWRSLGQRPGSTALTVGSFMLVVLVLVGMLSMIRGIDESLIGSGAPDRFFVINKNATAENQSQLAASDALAVGAYPQIKLDARAKPMTSFEVVATTYVTAGSDEPLQINFRGVHLPDALPVHGQVELVDGRYFDPNADGEILAGRGALEAMGLGVGDVFQARQRSWRIVGAFSDESSPFESELWTSRTNMELYFNKRQISSVWALVRDPALTASTVAELNAAQSLSVYATTEEDYYEQGAETGQEMRALAWFVSTLMSIGAVFSAMNTMYASVADRMREFGTMRALGFPPRSVLFGTLLEAVILAGAGAALAGTAALLLNGLTFRMLVTGIGFVSFRLTVTPGVIVIGLGFSMLMGLIGGYLPARQAGRLPVVETLTR